MKNKIYLASFFLVIACAGILSCQKTEQLNCGCYVTNPAIITESENLLGTIVLNEEAFQGYKSYQNKFLIGYQDPNCPNCRITMVVCNENILPKEILDLKNDPSPILNIKFSGYRKPICDELISPGINTYENIVLTKINVE